MRSQVEPRADRALARAIAAASLLTLCVLFWPIAVRRMFVYADLGNFFLPVRIFLAESLARGVTPLWMPNLFCGFYAHGEGQIGIFHPLRWLLYRILPVSEAFNAECLIPYPLALIGMALLLRRLALTSSAANFGGLCFAFSAYLTVRLNHLNMLAVIAHVGWLLFAIDVVIRDAGRRRRRAWLAIALLTGSQLLVGSPIAVAYCWLIALPYAVFLAARHRKPWPGAALAGALAAGLLLGAIQILPTLDHLISTRRAAPSYADLTAQSLHPWNLLTIVAPWLFRGRLYVDETYNPIEQVLYLGAVVPIATLWTVLRWKRIDDMRPLATGLLCLSGAGLILALGRHTPVYPWIAELPVIGLLRAPARFSVLIYFAGSVLAAIAFADLQRGDRSPERQRLAHWIWAVPALSWLVAWIALGLRDSSGQIAAQLASARWIMAGPLVFTLAAALFFAAIHGRRWALLALALFALVDLAVYGASLWWMNPPETIAEYRARVPAPPATPPQRVATWRDLFSFRNADGRLVFWASTAFVAHEARLISGYAALVPSKQLDYAAPTSLRIAGATTKLIGRRFERLSGALPYVRMVANAVPSAQPSADIESIDVATTALVDEPVDLEAGPAGEATIERELPGVVRIAARTPTRQLLVLAESFHPGWRVAVDGEERRVIRVYGDFMGCVVEPGSHEVSFRFAPRSFRIGRWTSLVGIAIVLAVALAGLRHPP